MATENDTPYKLTTPPELAERLGAHYVFIERVGPFQVQAPAAWQDLHRLLPAVSEHNQITGYFALYRVGAQVYRAGVSVSAQPKNLPGGLKYEELSGGSYARFTMTGSYANLAAASGRAFQMFAESGLPMRDDYNIENYVNDPRTTPEEQLITEILFPI